MSMKDTDLGPFESFNVELRYLSENVRLSHWEALKQMEYLWQCSTEEQVKVAWSSLLSLAHSLVPTGRFKFAALREVIETLHSIKGDGPWPVEAVDVLENCLLNLEEMISESGIFRKTGGGRARLANL